MAHEDSKEFRSRDDCHRQQATSLQLADVLHDGLVQWLALALIELDSFKSECAPDGSTKLANARALVKEALSAARRTIRDLQEPLPIDGDLRDTVAAIVESLQFSGCKPIAFSSHLPLPAVPSTVAADLAAASRELLINARKHAPGASIHLTLKPARDGVELMVADDGAGLDAASAADPARSGGGHGLQAVGRRLNRIGAHFHLQFQPGSGVRACILWPGVPAADHRETCTG